MATVIIPWTTGNGNITLTFTGQGNNTVTVSSDINELTTARSQVLTIKTKSSPAKTATMTITQQAGKGEILITVNSEPITLIDNDTIAVNV